MTKYYCQFDNNGGATRNDLPGGGTWTRVYYLNTSTDHTTGPTDAASLYSATVALWNDIKADILENNKYYGGPTGVYIEGPGSWGTSGSDYTANLAGYLPGLAGSVRPQHYARSTKYGVPGVVIPASTGFVPYGGADAVAFDQTMYTTATTAMSLIRARSFDYQPGTNRARALATFQISADNTVVWWDDNPPWITFAEATQVDGATHVLVNWTADNNTDTYWKVDVWGKYSGVWALHNTGAALALGDGVTGYDTNSSTFPEEVRVYMVRNDNRATFMAMDAPVPCVGAPTITAHTSSLTLGYCGGSDNVSTGTVTLSAGLAGTYEIYWAFKQQLSGGSWTDWQFVEISTNLSCSTPTHYVDGCWSAGAPTYGCTLRTQWFAQIQPLSNAYTCDTMVSTNDDTQTGYSGNCF